jgi:hypothetical protein
MSKIEHALALPLKRNINLLQLAAGSAIAIVGTLLTIEHLVVRL